MIDTIAAALLAKLMWLLSWTTIKSAIGIAFALGIVIFVHELGHYLACLLVKIRVEEFAIGFGKVLKKWKRGDTVYSLRAIPLGGFVKPAGESYARETVINDPGEFAAKPWYLRSFMVFSGAAMNYVLAFVIFFFVVILTGLPITNPKLIPPVVGDVVAGYPAQAAGLQKGDKVTAINAAPVNNWEELVNNIVASPSNTVLVEFTRGAESFKTEINLSADKKIGVSIQPIYERTTVFNAIRIAGHQCYYWTALSLKTIGEKLWAGQAPDVAGPIGIFKIVGENVHKGLEDYFFLIAMISVAIGMFNLFPIPILDGGHILFFVIEAIRGKRIKERTLGIASTCGAVFLLALVVFATYSDIIRIKAGRVPVKAAVVEQVAAEK